MYTINFMCISPNTLETTSSYWLSLTKNRKGLEELKDEKSILIRLFTIAYNCII